MAKVKGTRAGSRLHAMLSLAVGESVVFTGEPGEPAKKLGASLSSAFRYGRNITNQGLELKYGLSVFVDELPRPCVRVTRVAEPTFDPEIE